MVKCFKSVTSTFSIKLLVSSQIFFVPPLFPERQKVIGSGNAISLYGYVTNQNYTCMQQT